MKEQGKKKLPFKTQTLQKGSKGKPLPSPEKQLRPGPPAKTQNDTTITQGASVSASVPAPAPAPEKLTKQQKRDLKRNAAAKALQFNKRASSAKALSDGSLSKKVVPVPVPQSQQLSSSVYKRQVEYPRPCDKSRNDFHFDRFVEPSDGSAYTSLRQTSYLGFIEQPPSAFARSFHEKVLVESWAMNISCIHSFIHSSYTLRSLLVHDISTSIIHSFIRSFSRTVSKILTRMLISLDKLWRALIS